MQTKHKEFWVGCLVIGAVGLMGVFAWLMGVIDPFTKSVQYHLLYNFAGGVEVGSPVRVAGVKVGKVEQIEFLPLERAKGSKQTALQITISVSHDAAPSVRQDSKFFVNMAGIIGERYIEVSPGTLETQMWSDGSFIRGEDPPRIDQLLSQGYGVFEKVQEYLEENKDTVSEFFTQLPASLKLLNKLLKTGDWAEIGELVKNVNLVTKDIQVLTGKLQKPEAQQVLDRLYELISRAHQVDKEALKQFLQEEGIRARIF